MSAGADEERTTKSRATTATGTGFAGLHAGSIPTLTALGDGVSDVEIVDRDRTGLHEQAAMLVVAGEGEVAAVEGHVLGHGRQVAAQRDVGGEGDGVAVRGSADGAAELGSVGDIEVGRVRPKRHREHAGCQQQSECQARGRRRETSLLEQIRHSTNLPRYLNTAVHLRLPLILKVDFAAP